MPQSRNLKRQILREAVADNVATRSGAPPKAPRAAAPASKRRWPWLLVAILPVAAVPFLSRSVETPTPAVTVAAEATSPPASPSEPEPTFAAPTPLGDGVLPLAVRNVVLDPGHGGDDWGTASGKGPSALIEKELTLDIAHRLSQRLVAAGFGVRMTRVDDRKLSLRERTEIANRDQADLFVSIHVNWFGARHVRGVETYYLGPTEDPELNELARLENRASGYSLADMRSLLEGIYADVRQDQSRRLAQRVQRSLYRSLLPTSPGLRDRGVKTAPFVVLVATEMPAILAEVSCLSNREEAERLTRPRYREHIADALFQGIEAYAHEVNPTEEKEADA